MKHLALIAAIPLALAACTSQPIVVENTGRTVVLSGGPASISSDAEAIEYHQPTADRLCRESGHSRAQSAGSTEALFIMSYTFSCVA